MILRGVTIKESQIRIILTDIPSKPSTLLGSSELINFKMFSCNDARIQGFMSQGMKKEEGYFQYQSGNIVEQNVC